MAVASDLDQQDLSDADFQCFIAGTKILTAEGLKNIEDITSGDDVWAYDLVASNSVLKSTLQTFIRRRDSMIELHVGECVIQVTPEHPFLIKGHGWRSAGALKQGDLLLAFDGREACVQSVDQRPGPFTVYNFEVEDLHDYFVGDIGVLVHNPWGRGYHHYATVGLGSRIPYGARILRQSGKLPGYRHAALHRALNRKLRATKDPTGKYDMMPRSNQSGAVVRSRFTPQQRLKALRSFYKTYQNGKYFKNFQREATYIRRHPGTFR